MKLYLVTRPSLKGTNLPVYNYTFANNEEEAISKVRLTYGEYDKYIFAKRISDEDLEKLVIGTNFI